MHSTRLSIFVECCSSNERSIFRCSRTLDLSSHEQANLSGNAIGERDVVDDSCELVHSMMVPAGSSYALADSRMAPAGNSGELADSRMVLADSNCELAGNMKPARMKPLEHMLSMIPALVGQEGPESALEVPVLVSHQQFRTSRFGRPIQPEPVVQVPVLAPEQTTTTSLQRGMTSAHSMSPSSQSPSCSMKFPKLPTLGNFSLRSMTKGG